MQAPRIAPSTALAALAALFFAAAAAGQDAGWRSPIPHAVLYEHYNQGELYALDFLSRHVGWAVGGHGNATLIFRTRDGGATWDRLQIYDGVEHTPSFRAIRFADARNGWIAGDVVLRTADGGESWEPIDVEPATRVAVSSMLVLSPMVVILGSQSRNGRQIHVTTNGGASWTVATVSSHGSDDVTALAVGPDGAIYATTGSMYLNRGGVHRSQDGGRSWEPVIEGGQPLRAIAFHGSRGVAAGDGVAYWTEDGGASWKRVVASGRRDAVAFVDAQRVIALGSQPHVLLSEDGGRTWAPGRGPGVGEFGHLVAVAMADIGWWFVAGGRGANALFHYVDPDYLAPVGGGRVPLPVDVALPGGGALPRGVYDVTLGHRGERHVLTFGRVDELPPPEPSDGSAANGEHPAEEAEPPSCADPCAVELPVEVEYGVEELSPDGETARLQLRVEPTPTGVTLVLDAAANPPRDLSLALAAVGAPQDLDVEAAPAAAAAKEKAGGLFGRLRKAAAGDLRGAAAGAAVNPRAADDNLRAAKAAPPAVYRIRLRYTLDLFAPVGAP